MSDAYAYDGSKTRLGSRAAVVVATVVALVVGVTAGYPLQTLLGVLGGLAFAAAGRSVAGDGLRERVRGSSLLVVASVFVVFALSFEKASLADAVVVAAVPLAVGSTALGAFTDTGEAGPPIFSALGRSFVATLFGTLLSAALYADVFVGVVVVSWSGFAAGLEATPLFGFLALQCEFLLVGLLASKAGRAAAAFDPGRDPEGVDGLAVRDVPRAVWALLGVQVLALAFPGGPGLFEFLLDLAGPAGWVAGIVLSSGYVHGVLLFVAAVLATLPAAAFVRARALDVVGSRPPRTLAYATGGVGFAAVVVLLTSIPGVTWLVKRALDGQPRATTMVEAYGVGPSALAAVTGILFVMALFLVLYGTAVSLPFVPAESSGFVVGAAGLFAAATGGAYAGAPAPAVFLAMAAAIAVWDLGDYSTTLGAELGRAASTRPVEAVHGLGTLLVGALAVVVAALATHFFVPAMTGVPESRALAALGLLTVAMLAFAYLASSGEDADSAG